MPFHLCNSFTMKHSPFEYQKIHEYEYKRFLKTLKTNNSINITEQKLLKNHEKCYNNNYLFRRQMNLQSRQDKRKIEYERIQKENLKFSQRLINAKACLNRNEQQLFFDKHCQIKQRLQRYPDLRQTNTKKPDFQFLPNTNLKIINQPIDSSFLIYNDNDISSKSIKLREKHSQMNNQMFISKDPLSNINKLQTNQKKLPRLGKHNSQFSKMLPSITTTTQSIE